jgi:hypothetical protein
VIFLNGKSWDKSLYRFPCVNKKEKSNTLDCGAIAGGTLKSDIEGERDVVIYAQKTKNQRTKYFMSSEGSQEKYELNSCTP